MRMQPRTSVLQNGQVISESDIRISPRDRGFLLGDGAFETMRADDGIPHRLHAHVHRMADALRTLRIAHPLLDEDAHFAAKLGRGITALLEANGLREGPVRLRWTVTRGSVDGPALPAASAPTDILSATRYHPPTIAEYTRGWKLHAMAAPLTGELARVKSVSRLALLLARQAALDCGCTEALLFDEEGNVAETTTASVLVLAGKAWIAPHSPSALVGITSMAVCDALRARGISVRTARVSREELTRAEALWLTNALMGVMPVAAVDAISMARRHAGLAAEIRTEIHTGQPRG